MKKLLLILLCLPMIGFGQSVLAPSVEMDSKDTLNMYLHELHLHYEEIEIELEEALKDVEDDSEEDNIETSYNWRLESVYEEIRTLENYLILKNNINYDSLVNLSEYNNTWAFSDVICKKIDYELWHDVGYTESSSEDEEPGWDEDGYEVYYIIFDIGFGDIRAYPSWCFEGLKKNTYVEGSFYDIEIGIGYYERGNLALEIVD